VVAVPDGDASPRMVPLPSKKKRPRPGVFPARLAGLLPNPTGLVVVGGVVLLIFVSTFWRLALETTAL